MTDDASPPDPNPYEVVTASFASAPVSRPKIKPGGLTAVCVLAIVLGVLGGFAGLLMMPGLVFGKQMQQMFNVSTQTGQQDDFIEARDEIQKPLYAVMDRFWVPNIVQLLVRFVVAGCLVVSGVMTMMLKPAGRKLLLGVCCAAIVFEIGSGTLYGLIQSEMFDVTSNAMGRMTESIGPSGDPDARRTIITFTRVTMFVSMAFWSVLVVAKLSFYAFTVHYLNRPYVRPLFVSEP